MDTIKRTRKFYSGQRIVIDDFCIDRCCDKPDAFMPIPNLPKYGISAENVPLRREATFIGYIVDWKEEFVNGKFTAYCYKVRLDRKQRNFILPISQQEFWTTENSYARRIRKADN